MSDVLDLRGTALCPPEVQVDLAATPTVTVDVPSPALDVVTVDICAASAEVE